MAKAKKKESPPKAAPKAAPKAKAALPPGKGPKAKAKPKAKPKGRPKPRKVVIPGTPGTPGELEPGRDPFLSAEDTWDMGEEEQAWADEQSQIERERDERLAALPQTLDDIKRNAASVRERQSESAIDRGIFQSSINEVALTDINVAETVSTEAAKSLVANAQAELERVKNDIETVRRPRLYVRAAQRSRENAEAWNADREYTVDPTPATADRTAMDYDPRTPGIQNRQQANRNAAKRSQQQPNKPGGGRGTQKPQPNRPGGPRKAIVRPQPPRGPKRDTLKPAPKRKGR